MPCRTPQVGPRLEWRHWSGPAACLVLLVTACDRATPISSTSPARREVRAYRVSGAAADPVMGQLSGPAMTIAAALEVDTGRALMRTAFSQIPRGSLGVDLQNCDAPSSAGNRIVRLGTSRLLTDALALCDLFRLSSGMMLYVSKDLIARWDGRTLPYVTAVEDVTASASQTFAAYRGSTQVLTLSENGPFDAPVIVLLPIRASGGRRSFSAPDFRTRAHP